jgi:acyl carrier protein
MYAERIQGILREIKQYDGVEIHEGTNLIEDLHFDSMEVMTLILRIEEAFHVSFRDEHLDLEHFLTVGSILATLDGYGADAR